MHDVSLNGQAKKVAATCDELSRWQLLRLMPVLYGPYYSDAYRPRLEILRVLLGISPALTLRITPVQWCQLLWLTDFLLSEQLVFTRQLLPWARARWWGRRRYGPADGLSNVRFLEFVFADSYFVAFAQSQDEKYLHRLLSVLYRPQRRPYRPRAANYGGDRREDFNENLVGERAGRWAARLPQAQQLAILTWYRGCRHALERRYPLVFTPANEDKASENAGGWAYVLREMSGAAFGNFEETGRQHLHTVLSKMEDDTRRAQELQRQAEAQRTSY